MRAWQGYFQHLFTGHNVVVLTKWRCRLLEQAAALPSKCPTFMSILEVVETTGQDFANGGYNYFRADKAICS